MSDLNRASLQLIAETLGRARAALVNPYGDTSKNPGALLALEAAFCRLRGATLFHDSDYALNYQHFGVADPIGLGIQGAVLNSPVVSALPFQPTLPMGVSWNPEYYGPPSPEGWGYFDYNGWTGYRPTPLTTNGTEPSSGAGRLAYNYPVKYSSGTYQQVGFWESARYISLYNNTGSTIVPTGDTAVQFTLAADDLEGVRLSDPLTGAPQDLRFYSHPYLIQGGGNPPTWTASATMPATGDSFNTIDYTITPNATAGSWDIILNVPSNVIAWGNNQWWHIVMYWGSLDTFALATPHTYNRTNPITVMPSITWPRKNFFRKEITNHLEWLDQNINADKYLIARNRTHFNFIDGQYSNPTIPDKYILPDMWPMADTNGVTGSLSGYVEIAAGNAVPIALIGKTTGTTYDDPHTNLAVLVGPEITPEFWEEDWSKCPYFPPVPVDYVLLARAVLTRAPGATYGIVEDHSSNYALYDPNAAANTHTIGTSIAWIEQVVPSYALPPLGDSLLAQYLLQPAYNLATHYRSQKTSTPLLDIAFNTLVPGAKLVLNNNASYSDIADAASRLSVMFHRLLKAPSNPDLQDEGVSTAIPFAAPGRGIIYDLSGTTPTTEIMRLDADYLAIKPVLLDNATALEIYLDPSQQCYAAENNSAGDRLGQDYTLRLFLRDGNENTFVKDWYLMASRYFLSGEEFRQRLAAQLSVKGYFTDSPDYPDNNISLINEFRVYGYAGLVPDLNMGKSQTMFTRMVAPPDSTKTTEEQFRKNLENEGQTPKQINEAVLQYLEDGGEFYTVNTAQYDNTFVALDAVGVTVSSYNETSVPYWTTGELDPYFNPEYSGSAPAVASLRADSFTIAPSGLAAGDLEHFGTQATVVYGQSPPTGTNHNLNYQLMAFKITTTAALDTAELAVRLKVALDVGKTALDNDHATLQMVLCADSAGSPGAILSEGSTIQIGDISTTVYTEKRFGLAYHLAANSVYWMVVKESAVPSGGTIVFDGNNSGTNIKYFGTDNVWHSTAGTGWLRLYGPEVVAVGVFNRNEYAQFPPANSLRQVDSSYIMDGYWSYTSTRLTHPTTLTVYPRAVYDTTSSTWQYVRFNEDVYICVRFLSGGVIVDKYVQFAKASSDLDAAPTPLSLGSEIAETVVYLAVAKTAAELQTATHGAPAGDRLVLRSA